MDQEADSRMLDFSDVQGAYIADIEYIVPANVVTNADLAAAHPEWQIENVAERTGVYSRYWCDAQTTALDLGERACRRLLDRTGFDAARIDTVVFCTQTPDYPMPPNACLLQARLGLPTTVAAFDISLACSGFVYGLYIAKSLVIGGQASNVLLVTAETYSKRTHPGDRGTRTLFGDGGACTLVRKGRGTIGPFRLGTDGARAQCFYVPAGGARQPASEATSRLEQDQNGNMRTAEHIVMQGAAVLDFVKREVPGMVRDLLRDADITMESLDLVLLHQASKVTLDCLYSALRIPVTKRFSDLARFGNTVSASLPIVMRNAQLAGVLRPGMKVLAVSFGVGLSWGSCLIEWREDSWK